MLYIFIVIYLFIYIYTYHTYNIIYLYIVFLFISKLYYIYLCFFFYIILYHIILYFFALQIRVALCCYTLTNAYVRDYTVTMVGRVDALKGCGWYAGICVGKYVYVRCLVHHYVAPISLCDGLCSLKLCVCLTLNVQIRSQMHLETTIHVVTVYTYIYICNFLGMIFTRITVDSGMFSESNGRLLRPC